MPSDMPQRTCAPRGSRLERRSRSVVSNAAGEQVAV
jgi:hypothetical protein